MPWWAVALIAVGSFGLGAIVAVFACAWLIGPIWPDPGRY